MYRAQDWKPGEALRRSDGRRVAQGAWYSTIVNKGAVSLHQASGTGTAAVNSQSTTGRPKSIRNEIGSQDKEARQW